MTSSLLVSSCTFNRLGWEGTRGWTWTLLGLKRVAEADESASGWASVGPYSSRGGKNGRRHIHGTAERAWGTSMDRQTGKAYLAGMQGPGCSGGTDLLTACLSGQPPLGQPAWREAAASDQQRLKKIFHILVSEASITSQMSLLYAGATVLTPLHTQESCKSTKSWSYLYFLFSCLNWILLSSLRLLVQLLVDPDNLRFKTQYYQAQQREEEKNIFVCRIQIANGHLCYF